MTIMIIATARLPITNFGYSGNGDADDQRGPSQRRSDVMERPRRDCRTRSRAPFGRAPAGAKFLALGRRHSCTPPPSPSRARAMHRATGRLTGSGKGSVSC